MFSKLIVEQPWYHVLLCLLLAALPAVWLYLRNRKNSEAPPGILKLLMALRFFSFFLLLLLLLSIFYRRVKIEKEAPLILVAIDNSSSMAAGPDSADIKKLVSGRLTDLQAKLGDKYTVKTLLFGNSVRQSQSADFKDRETDLDQLLRETENSFANQNIGALVVLTDGIYNRGTNPIYRTEKTICPIWIIGTGDTASYRDISIQKINHNEVVYAGNNFPLEIQVNAVKCAGETARLQVFEGNKLIQSRELKINQDQFSTISTFTLSSENPGIQRYKTLVSISGQEKNSGNNARSLVVEVISARQKIILLSHAPHPDIAAIREAISSNSGFELDFYQLPAQPSSLKGANLVILHGYNSSYLSLLNACKAATVPYWIVDPSSFEGLSGLRVTAIQPRVNDTEPLLTSGFGNFSLSEEFKRFIPDLPAVKTIFARYESSAGAQILLRQKTGSVETDAALFSFHEENGLKSAVFAGDGLWQWRMRDFSMHQSTSLFNELIGKTVQYLSVKNDKSFFRVNAPRIVSENENAEVEAEVYNKSYEPVTESEVTLELLDRAGKKFNYTFNKGNQSYHLDLGQLSPGDYSYKATTNYNKEVLVKQGLFAVNEVVSEKLGQTADHSLLRQIAQRSTGRFFKLKDAGQLEEALQNNNAIRPLSYAQSMTSPLLDFQFFFWLVLVLLSVEWIFRKRYLSI